jgi:hypothetical protein
MKNIKTIQLFGAVSINMSLMKSSAGLYRGRGFEGVVLQDRQVQALLHADLLRRRQQHLADLRLRQEVLRGQDGEVHGQGGEMAHEPHQAGRILGVLPSALPYFCSFCPLQSLEVHF